VPVRSTSSASDTAAWKHKVTTHRIARVNLWCVASVWVSGQLCRTSEQGFRGSARMHTLPQHPAGAAAAESQSTAGNLAADDGVAVN
jgi:hypothetical protein